ncbi:DNA-binding transcriptional regulator BolA [Aliiroseovarius pelagivivens]|uniref:DNA-binding transcriptional regulator BolA n=1 Tax=Aliiroseovarius pelagivivens TaxID=1639690 RepID=A0A2R8AKI5_9RHOB|nr:BolA family protein [Aliiroseovarius pelagivivens]SPF76558.1 DNA-binding transcriptional regulator BolA [Aliiroseovarius pelagivivens]
MNRSSRINQALTDAFDPEHLEVIDESEKHIGHSGYQEGGESHFQVVIRAPVFSDMSRIARHRAVHKALGAELVSEIHALALDISG